tara:strand:+ start:24294 stop:25541 length:1248 start_codon:yes stop_codon:yes gene_type:complete
MPTRLKVIGLTVLAVFICYIDRVNISITIIPMAKELGWDYERTGLILTSFYIGYIFTQVLGGSLSDKLGAKIVLGYGLIIWSVFTILTPLAASTSFTVLILARIGMGLGEGITFPAWHSLYARWIPLKERARAVAFTNSGIPIGTAFALIVTPIIVVRLGWEWAFYLFGGVGFIWFFFWQRMVTSVPKDHPSISKEELDLIETNAPTSEKAESPPWKELITNKPLWAIGVAHFCSNYSLFVFLSWLPLFINEGLGVEFESVGYFAMLPHLSSLIFMNVGGYFGDYLLRSGIKILNVRKICNTIGFGGAGICLMFIPSFEAVSSVIALMCLGNAFSGMAAGGFIVNHADIGPKYTGTLMGLTNMLGAIPGIVGVYLTGLILNATNSWDSVFYVTAGVTFFGMIFYLLFASASKQFD